MYSKNRTLTLDPGHSALSGQTVEVVALFADLRGFSSWTEQQSPDSVANLMKNQFERALQIADDHHLSFHKFLGDGFLMLWEADEEVPLHACLAQAIDATFHLHKKYWYFTQRANGALPPGYGVGISAGSAVRIQPETFIAEWNEVDFVGYPLNCAARMQTLASGYGTVLSASASRLMNENDSELLYSHTPGFRRGLITPQASQLRRAAGMKGLRPKDRTDFRYLVFLDSAPELWTLDGMPTD